MTVVYVLFGRMWVRDPHSARVPAYETLLCQNCFTPANEHELRGRGFGDDVELDKPYVPIEREAWIDDLGELSLFACRKCYRRFD